MEPCDASEREAVAGVAPSVFCCFCADPATAPARSWLRLPVAPSSSSSAKASSLGKRILPAMICLSSS